LATAQLRFDAERKANVQLLVVHTTEVDKWIAEHHYLKSTPCGARLRFWVLVDGKRVGAMMWGRPTARNLDQWKLLELTRMYFIDDTPPFIESRALSMARKYIRKHMPEIKGLIAYSSTGQGHEGTVYEADGWFQLGVTRGTSWENRPGRTDRDLSDKIRWVRSP